MGVRIQTLWMRQVWIMMRNRCLSLYNELLEAIARYCQSYDIHFYMSETIPFPRIALSRGDIDGVFWNNHTQLLKINGETDFF